MSDTSITATTTTTVTGVRCPRCSESIWSRHRHDFRYCKCQYTFIDGGRAYLRYGFGDPFSGELTHGKPEEVEIEPVE